MKAAVTNKNDASPYSPQNVDFAIKHLERVVRAQDSKVIFAQTYWRGRILEVLTTLGLVQTQQERLHRLLDCLTSDAVNLNKKGSAIDSRNVI